MSSPALSPQTSKDRRDILLLGMARDASRVKVKAKEALHKKIRPTGYRRVRYQRFKGRQEDVFDDEIRERRRLRRVESIQFMEAWLSAQTQANSEEGSPRDISAATEAATESFQDP